MLALTMTHDFHADTAATPQCRPPDVSLCVSLVDGLFERGVGAEPPKSGRRRSRISYRPGEYRRPRDTGGTHPGRFSCVWNVVIPSGSGPQGCARYVDR